MKLYEARLWRKILSTTRYEPSGCYVWTGALNSDGYGITSLDGTTKTVHRIVLWMLADMELTDPAPVLHHCDNPPCWNPEHLYVGTYSQNTRDALRRGRIQPRQGSNSSRATITEEIAHEIKLRLRTGERQANIANSLGLTKSLVNSIATGLTWGHVQLPHSPESTYCPDCGVELFVIYRSPKRKRSCMSCYMQEKRANY